MLVLALVSLITLGTPVGSVVLLASKSSALIGVGGFKTRFCFLGRFLTFSGDGVITDCLRVELLEEGCLRLLERLEEREGVTRLSG